MSSIIIGHFADAAHVEQAQAALAARGFDAGEYASYYLNPPGQHGLYRLGGDAASDEGASDAGRGARAAAAVGGAAGLAIGSLVGGPIGALAGAGVGAYVGSLAGALGRTHTSHPHAAGVEHPAEPPAGPMLCVCVDRAGSQDTAVSALKEAGAWRIELASGTWADGEWQDLDPHHAVEVLHGDPAAGHPAPAA